jgi:hypothetical protein
VVVVVVVAAAAAAAIFVVCHGQILAVFHWIFGIFTVVLFDYSFVTRFVAERLDDVLRNPDGETLI